MACRDNCLKAEKYHIYSSKRPVGKNWGIFTCSPHFTKNLAVQCLRI